MSKLRKTLLILFCFIFLLSSPLVKTIYARGESECRSIGVDYVTNPKQIPENISQIKLNFTSGLSNGKYRLRIAVLLTGIIPAPNIHQFIPENGTDASGGKASFTINSNDGKLTEGGHDATLEKFYTDTGSWNDYCQKVHYDVGYSANTCTMTVTPREPTDVEQIRLDINYAPAEKYRVLLNDTAVGEVTVGNDGTGNIIIGPLSPISNAALSLRREFDTRRPPERYCRVPNFTIKASGGATPRPAPSVAPSPPPLARPAGIPTTSGGPDTQCGTKEEPGIRTAIGCIHTSPTGFIKDFLKFILGISGGLAFLMMILGAFQMLTSAGNPDTLVAGRERLTSAIIGLLFVIFAVLLLQIIGVGILNIPGFKP